MNIILKKLTPELMEDYLHFFDVTPHSTGKEEHRCYCVCWTSTGAEFERCATAEQRRELAREYLQKQFIQGYLAYEDNKVVGWCNANTRSDCYGCISWQMFMQNVRKDEDKVKSVFCFAIAPEYRAKGIATLLLERVCSDAQADGYDAVEAYPNTRFVDTEQDFMGPVNLFEKCGFKAIYQVGERTVMRKHLIQ